MEENIRVKGAKVNNLKNIDVTIPRDKLVVITGLSGSGKSSLAFDTLYAEGQRRYVESLSAYARQFLGRMKKPECTYIKGLPPAIAIEQKVVSRNPRSTVGTSTEIYDYLRLLFARVGRTLSPISGQEVKKHSVQDVVDCTLTYSEGTRYTVLAPFRLPEGRTMQEQLQVYMQQGISRLDIDGEVVRMEDVLGNPPEEGKAYLLIDRLSVSHEKDTLSRLADSVETAFYEGNGECMLRFYPAKLLHTFSNRFEADGITFREPDVNMFSFNSPLGACEHCGGYGRVIGIDEKLVIPDTSRSVYDGAVVCWRGEKMGMWRKEFIRRAQNSGFPIFKPYYELSQADKNMLWHGSKEEKSLPEEEQVTIDAFFRMLERGQYKIQYRVMLARYRGKTVCPVCNGSRLRPEAEYVKIGGKSITELVSMPVKELLPFFEKLELSESEEKVAKRLLEEIRSRLNFLSDVGLDYLTLDRPSNTLSGGESQRINLATRLGSALVGSLYILDEPSIGLHPRDTDRLISVLKKLRDQGNTVIIVEHDEEIMRAADWLIDIGPGAGSNGGKIVYEGKPVSKLPKEMQLENGLSVSHTLNYLCHLEKIKVPPSRRSWNKSILLKGARANNLKGINVEIPLNCMVVVTGVSGSGKSTLVSHTIYPALKRMLDEPAEMPGEYIAMSGDTYAIENVQFIDQKPIGTSSRSNPATYLKAFEEIRKVFSSTERASHMGMSASYFSFNSEGGRCPVCKGEGIVRVEMQFMANLELPCEECHGKRFKEDVLEVKFEGKNIYDVLEMTVDEAIAFFKVHHKNEVVKRLLPLQQVGLRYIKLGQSSSTLSGGENQRVKLAYYISQETPQPTLFIFDEPTTGLHFHDINCLLSSMNSLIERGHSLLIVEHNMEIIKSADYIIDLGPEGGRQGGEVVAVGTPEEIVAQGKGYTAKYLANNL